jgi:hypothetical protein
VHKGRAHPTCLALCSIGFSSFKDGPLVDQNHHPSRRIASKPPSQGKFPPQPPPGLHRLAFGLGAGELLGVRDQLVVDREIGTHVAPVPMWSDGRQEPDVLVLCNSAKADRRGLRGAPDLVVEVLTPGTASHDHVRKRRVYEHAGSVNPMCST